MKLSEKKCAPCNRDTPALSGEQCDELLSTLNGWSITKEQHLSKTYTFPDFISGLEWVNRLGLLAEEENHHPDVYLAWGKVRLELWTHRNNALTENDFILAAKLDLLEALESADA